MVSTKIDIYLQKIDIETILLEEEKFQNLSHILKKCSTIFVNLNNTEIDDLLSEITTLLEYAPIDLEILPGVEFFKSLDGDYSQLLEKPRAIFILDIPTDKANELSIKYGTIILSSHNINDTVFQLSFYRQLEKGNLIKGKNNGWESLLHQISFPPFNSLVITDNYLFNHCRQNTNVGYENLTMMLNAILPANLETSFHLLIIAQMAKMSDNYSNSLCGKLKSYLKTIRDYNFIVEIAFTETLHPRKAISNYFVITCDKGFNLFDPLNRCKIFDDNDFRVLSILHDSKHSQGETLYAVSQKDLSKLKEICVKLRERLPAQGTDYTKKIIGDTAKNKTIRNRLLNNDSLI